MWFLFILALMMILVVPISKEIVVLGLFKMGIFRGDIWSCLGWFQSNPGWRRWMGPWIDKMGIGKPGDWLHEHRVTYGTILPIWLWNCPCTMLKEQLLMAAIESRVNSDCPALACNDRCDQDRPQQTPSSLCLKGLSAYLSSCLRFPFS